MPIREALLKMRILYIKKSQKFLYIYKLIKLAYITNFIIILNTSLAKKFGLGLKTSELSNNFHRLVKIWFLSYY